MKKLITLAVFSTAAIVPALSYADDGNNNDVNIVNVEFNSMASNDIKIGQDGSYKLVSPESLSLIDPASIAGFGF